jgi:hypothetical protein
LNDLKHNQALLKAERALVRVNLSQTSLHLGDRKHKAFATSDAQDNDAAKNHSNKIPTIFSDKTPVAIRQTGLLTLVSVKNTRITRRSPRGLRHSGVKRLVFNQGNTSRA